MDNKIQALLSIGEKPKDIAERLDISYHKVLNAQKVYKSNINNDSVEHVKALDPVALELIVEKAKAEAPTKVIKSLKVIQDGITGLQKLDSEFHSTFSLALGKAEEFLARDDLKPSEWVAITNALGNAYRNIFNDSGVKVNIDNSTSIQSDKLSMFKGSLRG